MGIPYNETWEDLEVYIEESLRYKVDIENLTYIKLDIENESEIITLSEEC